MLDIEAVNITCHYLSPIRSLVLCHSWNDKGPVYLLESCSLATMPQCGWPAKVTYVGPSILELGTSPNLPTLSNYAQLPNCDYQLQQVSFVIIMISI